MPMTPFIGVRISWLMLAKKFDLSWDASFAWMAERLSCRSTSFRSVMSKKPAR